MIFLIVVVINPDIAFDKGFPSLRIQLLMPTPILLLIGAADHNVAIGRSRQSLYSITVERSGQPR